MAQLVAHSLWERGVASSSLAAPTSYLKVSMKNIKIFAIGLLFSLNINAQDPESTQHNEPSIEFTGQQFIDTHVKSLTDEEVQVLANMMYFTYVSAQEDTYIRNMVQSLFQTAWLMRHATLHYNEDAILRLKEVRNSVAELDKKMDYHQELYAKLQACRATLEQLKPETSLAQAIEAYNLIMQYYINADVTNYAPAFNKALQSYGLSILEASEVLRIVGQTYQGLHENKFPVEVENGTEELVKVSIASNAANALESQCYNTMQTTNSIACYEAEIQDQASQKMAALYFQLYRYMQAKVAPQFRTILFDAHGIIPIEKRTKQLPSITQ